MADPAAGGSAIRVEGDTMQAFFREDQMCCMKIVDADGRIPLASVSAIVDEGNKVMVRKNRTAEEND